MKGLVNCSMKFLNKAIPNKFLTLLFAFFLVFSVSSGGSSFAADWTWQHPLPTGNSLEAVWGNASDDVFAVGDSGTILHYGGSS